MNKQLKKGNDYRSLSIAIVSMLGGIMALLMPDWRYDLLAQSVLVGNANPLTTGINVNDTQTNLANLIFAACGAQAQAEQGQSNLQPDLRDRCNAILGDASNNGAASTANALGAISPEQLTSYGVTATRTTASSLRVIGSAIEARMQNLRASLNSPASGTGLAAYQNGNAVSGGAAGADDSLVSPFGLWGNISYQAGDVNSTFVQRGYNFKNGGVTLGADMRLVDDLIVGAAFNYLAGDSYFDLSGGRSQTNSYTGSIYATYYVVDNFHLDGLASYGGTEYNLERSIQYAIPGDLVNTRAFGSPGGQQYSLSFGGGYDFSFNGFNLNPYTRIDNVGLLVNGFQESGGDGWAMRFGQQNVHSLRTVVGAQTSHAISTSFGVLLPSFRAEWVHEYMDNSRNIPVSLAGNSLAQTAYIVTLKPDRNYAIVGAGLSGTFAHGMSAFISYDALLGYQNVTSHKVMVGARLEF